MRVDDIHLLYTPLEPPSWRISPAPSHTPTHTPTRPLAAHLLHAEALIVLDWLGVEGYPTTPGQQRVAERANVS